VKQWDIVKTELPFTDFRGSKARPALVISADEINDPDCILAIITSKEHSEIYDYRIDKVHPEFEDTGLTTSSTFRFGKLITGHISLITETLGRAGPEIQKEAKLRLKRVFNL